MERKDYLSLIFLFLATPILAQNDGYNQFRQKMLNDYSDYRGQVLDNYAKFLDTVWKDYDSFRGESLFPDKKPKAIPNAPKVDDTPLSIIPSPDKPTEPKPKPSAPIEIKPEVPNPLVDNVSFQFYTAYIKAPKINVTHLNGVNERAISKLWAQFQDNNVYSKISSSLQQARLAYNLNDWLTYILVRKYSDAIYANDANSSLVLSHYILANMGFNVRIGKSSNGRILILIPFKQNIYERPFLKINGVRYYIFFEETGRINNKSIGTVSTCNLPKDASLGKSLNIVLENPVLPPKGYIEYTKSYGSMTLKGRIPEVAIMIGKDHLQTDVPVYASSTLSSEFRQDLLSQVASQISGLSEYEAVGKLLKFIQHAFSYKTDLDQFGYEKPFYVEENFYYPANDCEDRSILLAFLVRNLLHLDVHLLYYPRHEATAIKFSNQSINGDGYVYQDGSKYIICDPTYIGAGVGQCMPEYENVKPKVEMW